MTFRLGLIFALASVSSIGASAQTADEYRVKAAFIYNLAKFVEWPASSFDGAKDPIVVCILGQSPITQALEAAVSGKLVGDRPFVIRRVSEGRQTTHCQILFISSVEQNTLRTLPPEVKAAGVLTVGEVDTFIAEGGVVNFKLDEGRVRLQINVEAATQKRLRISSKLLSLVEIVRK